MRPLDFPSYAQIADGLLALILIRGAQGSLRPRECYGPLADLFELTSEQRARPRSDGRGGSAWENCVQWSRQLLINEGKLDGSVFGAWTITDAGRHQAARSPLAARLQAALNAIDPESVRSTQDYYIHFDDYTVDERWRLIEWCHLSGADEFSIGAEPDLRGSLQEEVVWHAAFPLWGQIQAFERPSAEREGFLYTEEEQVGADLRRLWLLTAETIIALRAHVPDAASSYDRNNPGEGHFEDLALYRDGKLMLAISASYGWAILRVTPEERHTLGLLQFQIEDEWGA